MEYMEMLARLGVGSAHPGGFSATVEQLREHPIEPGCRVLEVGCGTGRTACYLAKMGCIVTALDIRDDMLAKARRRADAEEAAVTFVQGSIEALPFVGGSFDAVIAESVTIFADVPLALSEYARVLCSGGTLYDREIIAVRPLPAEGLAAVKDFYRVRRLYNMSEWKELLLGAGFASSSIWRPSEFPVMTVEDSVRYPDLHQELDPDVYENEAVWETAKTYDDIMSAYHASFGFGLLIGRK
ncbi:class I SAM-dependent methyltransferase [Paenibacillus chartarius]|uniref:Class I SAM-dependent methyltransferase n=1 Tax=Paenibacillus chartarius TaxID=747481 RepID=A0ABV6DIR4_9BACL